MSDLTGFPDTEAALLAVLVDLAGNGTITPTNLADVLPFVRVMRFGGSDDLLTDTARVDVDCFAATRPAAQSLAEAVRQRMLSYPHVVDGVGTIDYATTDLAPNEVPWSDSQSVRRFTASYTVTTRR